MLNRISAIQIQIVIQYFVTTRQKKTNASSAAIPDYISPVKIRVCFQKDARDNRKENYLIKLNNLSNFPISRILVLMRNAIFVINN